MVETPELKLVKTPIDASILTRRQREGFYKNALAQVMKLKPTTIETGLSPHYEWQLESSTSASVPKTLPVGVSMSFPSTYSSLTLRSSAKPSLGEGYAEASE